MCAVVAVVCFLQVFTLLGFHEFMPSSEILSKLEGQMCKAQPYLCVNLLSIICGYNPDNLDIERLPIYLNFTPSGTSVKNMAKWAQVRVDNKGGVWGMTRAASQALLWPVARCGWV
jgi:lysosomal acid lipase/cholesteryl ester hydrolase/gastric triacylglycerol lipase